MNTTTNLSRKGLKIRFI